MQELSFEENKNRNGADLSDKQTEDNAVKKKSKIALIRGIKRVIDDINNIKDKDPAAKSVLEILLLYPGFHALLCYRIANKLKKPNGYVRSSAKDHGTKKLLEGCEVKNQNVLLIEDLITTGESVLKAANVLKELGAKSISIISIFSYNFNLAVQNFKKFNLNYQSLFSIHDLLSYYEKNDSNTYNTLLNWWNQYK